MKRAHRDIGACRPTAPSGWTVVLSESEAEHAAGRVVSGDDTLRELRNSLDRLDKPDEQARTHAIHPGP